MGNISTKVNGFFSINQKNSNLLHSDKAEKICRKSLHLPISMNSECDDSGSLHVTLNMCESNMRSRSNIDVFDSKLSEEEMHSFNTGER